MKKLFYKLRVSYKMLLKKLFLIPSFCKECGRDVHDFIVDDDVWHKISPLIDDGNVLCYDCFCEKCAQVGLPSYWKLMGA